MCINYLQNVLEVGPQMRESIQIYYEGVVHNNTGKSNRSKNSRIILIHTQIHFLKIKSIYWTIFYNVSRKENWRLSEEKTSLYL